MLDILSPEIVDVRVGSVRRACVLCDCIGLVACLVFYLSHLFLYVECECL